MNAPKSQEDIDKENALKAESQLAKKGKKVRVLVDCEINGEIFKPNDVATVADDVLKSLGNLVDESPAAVKYAESLK